MRSKEDKIQIEMLKTKLSESNLDYTKEALLYINKLEKKLNINRKIVKLDKTCKVKDFEFILKSLSLRKTQRDIAKNLNLSIAGIENRIKKIKKHYNVKSINELLELKLS